MLKALYKKQFMELFRQYLVNQKTGKARSKGQTIGFLLLFVFLLGYFGVLCFGMAFSLGEQLIAVGMDWLYFSLMSILAILLGTFGSIFNTYAALYRSKDNDLLISMPIPPRRIVMVRLTSVLALSMLYTGILWIPTVAYYWLFASPSVPAMVFSLLLWPVISAFVTVVTCALGWVVALVSSKISSKSFVTVVLSVILLGIYYVFCFRMSEFFTAMVENSEAIGGFLKAWFHFLYEIGQAAVGDVLGMLIVTGVTAVLSGLCLWLMARTFISLATKTATARKKKTKTATIRSHGIRAALLRRELKRFGSSATYILNCGLGLFFLVAIAVLALVNQSSLQGAIAQVETMWPPFRATWPLMAAMASCLIISMNVISTPSVSLEGKQLWIVQSLPVSPADVLRAKLWLHVLVNAELAMLTTGVLCFCLQTTWLSAVLAVVYTGVFVWLTGVLGLILGLKRPNLHWTNEATVIKQSLTVFLSLLINFGIAVLLSAPYFLLAIVMDASIYLAGLIAVTGAVSWVLTRWLTRAGAKEFAQL